MQTLPISLPQRQTTFVVFMDFAGLAHRRPKAELIRRNTFTEREWQMIEAKKVEPGLSECGVRAAYSLNVTKYYDHSDMNNNPIGNDMVFSCKEAPVPYCPFTKVEIREGKVSAVIPVSEP